MLVCDSGGDGDGDGDGNGDGDGDGDGDSDGDGDGGCDVGGDGGCFVRQAARHGRDPSTVGPTHTSTCSVAMYKQWRSEMQHRCHDMIASSVAMLCIY